MRNIADIIRQPARDLTAELAVKADILEGARLYLASEIEDYSNELNLTMTLKKNGQKLSESTRMIEYNKFLTTDGKLVEKDLEKVVEQLLWKAIDSTSAK